MVTESVHQQHGTTVLPPLRVNIPHWGIFLFCFSSNVIRRLVGDAASFLEVLLPVRGPFSILAATAAATERKKEGVGEWGTA